MVPGASARRGSLSPQIAEQGLLMTGDTTRYLIRGGRVYDHDGDIHQPATADILIRGGSIERIAPQIVPDSGVEVLDAAGKLVVPASSTRTTIRMT